MPTASDALRNKMQEYFDDAIDDSGPENYLREQGWTEDRWLWSAPERIITDKEWDCIQFLMDEWDHDYKSNPNITQA
jgi:hypothetical protein